MTNYVENSNNEYEIITIKRKVGRPSSGLTRKEHNDKHINVPENRIKHNARMALYREKNRAKINRKKRSKSLEKKLKKIWLILGKIE
jgi:hypothetical protein